MKYRKQLAIALCLAINLPQTSTLAANDNVTQDFTANKKSTLFADIPSVYSASKYEQKVTKAPASVSIVTADEIKKYGYRNFGQILSSLRGFYNTQDRNNGYVGARGFGLPSDVNSRMLLLIDGHRFNDSMFDAFSTAENFPVDVDIIERVEVVRGPSSSLYGTSAVFGVINIITKRGRDQHGANIKYSYGTNDTHKSSFSYGDRFSNGLEAFITGSYFSSQGYQKLFYEEFDSPSTNNGFSINNDDDQARKLMAKASYGDFSLQGLYVNRIKDFPTAVFGTPFNNHNANGRDQATFVELKYDHTFENQLNVQSRLSYNNYRFTGQLPTNVSNTSLVDSEWWRFEIEASKLIWNDHHITIGGQYQDNFRQFQNLFNSQDSFPSSDKTYQWAWFIQDDYSITDELTLNAGIRYDYYSVFNGDTINPRATLIYTPWQSTTFKLLYGEAFRAPNQFELNNTIPGQLLGNPNLKPENLNTLELIIEHYFTRQFRTELNAFHTNLKDNITAVATSNGVQNKNNRDVDSVGVEAQVENSWGDGFQARLSYSWQDTTDKRTGKHLTNSPEHMIKLNFIAPLWEDKVFLGFETQFMSSRRSPDRTVPDLRTGQNRRIPGRNVNEYVISNLTIFTQNWVKGLELSAGLYNLFDERYFDPASADHVQNAIQQDGLQFRIKGSLDF